MTNEVITHSKLDDEQVVRIMLRTQAELDACRDLATDYPASVPLANAVSRLQKTMDALAALPSSVAP